jgi:SAM-dependent methyltransferase
MPRLYSLRFSEDDRDRKARVWQVLCDHFFQRYVRPEDTVLDLGAGHCEFINHIVCRRRIAVDVSDVVRQYVTSGVEVIQASGRDLRAVGVDSVDVVFASNFFEHLNDKTEVLDTLTEVRRVLRPGGKCLILQPNIRYTGGAYWDFFDHHLPLTERSLLEALQLVGLVPVEVRPRFLPFTTRSAFPQHPWLVWLYLKLPIIHRLLGQQSWIVSTKASRGHLTDVELG